MALPAQIAAEADERWQRVVVPYLDAAFAQAARDEALHTTQINARNYRDGASDRRARAVLVERNTALPDLAESRVFGRLQFPKEADGEELREWALRRSRVCSGIHQRAHGDTAEAFENMAAYVRHCGLPVPKRRNPAARSTGRETLAAAIRRMQCSRWWKRTGRTCKLRQREARAIAAGQVRKQAAFGVSDAAVSWRRDAQRHNADLMADLMAVNQSTGLCLDMGTVIAGSLANPRVRAAEIGMRSKGMETEAERRGWLGFAAHLTAPSRFHARIENTGKRNPKWQGATPRQGQDYLREVWGLVRAKWAKAKIEFFGLRCAEPHHDGTPHWHLLIFCAPEHAERAQQIMRSEALRDTPDEDGAQKHRCRVVPIDNTKGSATSYILKYILKGIAGGVHGEAMAPAENGELTGVGFDAPTHAERIVTWAWLWGIRQFQTYGKPGRMAEWREFRRMREPLPEQLSLLEPYRQAADEGRFADFVKLAELGPVRIIRETAEDLGVQPLTAYGERAELRVVGVGAFQRLFIGQTKTNHGPARRVGYGDDYSRIEYPHLRRRHLVRAAGRCEQPEQIVLTREDRWSIERKDGRAAGMEPAAPWTRVNNCNHPPEPDRKPDRDPDPPPGFTPDEWSEWCQA